MARMNKKERIIKPMRSDMTHEGKRIQDSIDRLKISLEQPITPERRRDIQAAIRELERKKREWSSPKAVSRS